MASAKIYGVSWSVDTWDLRRLLAHYHVSLEYIDLDQDETARSWVESLARHTPAIPVVCLPDGSLLLAASRRDLAKYYGFHLETGKLNPMALHGEQIPAEGA